MLSQPRTYMMPSVTCRVNAFFMLGVGSLRAAAAVGEAAPVAAALLGSRSAGVVVCQKMG